MKAKNATLAAARRAASQHEEELLALERVQGIGIIRFRGKPAVAVYVSPGASHEGIPPKVDGIPVLIEERGPIHAF
ncbi:hypothetical protein ACWD0A_01835 [Streptomyces sp. NPDC002867]